MSGYYHCGEVLADDQSECPFCGQQADEAPAFPRYYDYYKWCLRKEEASGRSNV